MPDFTYSHIAAAGAPVNDDGINQNTCDQGTNSLNVLNGRLDKDNQAGSWAIRSHQIRNRSMGNGQMVGSTGNLDYSSAGFTDTNADSQAYAPVPGCGISFYLPVTPSFLVITWQVVASNDADFSTAAELTELRFFVDSVRQSSQFRQAPAHTRSSDAFFYPQFDRLWSGHWCSAQAGTGVTMSKGWHNAHVGVYSSTPTTRLRVRNMKYFWLK